MTCCTEASYTIRILLASAVRDVFYYSKDENVGDSITLQFEIADIQFNIMLACEVIMFCQFHQTYY